MIWRSAIVAAYIALAILIAVAYGVRGLAILSFFYFWAGSWVAFLLVWGWAARAAGRWNFQRLDSDPLHPDRNGSPGVGDTEPVPLDLGVARDPLHPREPTQRQPVPAL